MNHTEQHTHEKVVIGHTIKCYDEELNNLRSSLAELGQSVLKQVQNTLIALTHKDMELARSIMQMESRVNASEIDIDAKILKIIARRGPVGKDLRVIVAVSKCVVDLERIGDEAAKIASIVANIYGSNILEPNNQLFRDVYDMGLLAIATLERAIDFSERLDGSGARALRAEKPRLEAAFEAGLRRLITYVMQDSRNIGFMVDMVLAMKAFERIAAHAHNLAEFVIYQIEGEDIRHQNSEPYSDISDNAN